MAAKYEMTLFDYMLVIKKRVFIIAFIALFAGALSVAYAYSIPSVYVSSGRVQVVRQRVPEVTADPYQQTMPSPIEMETLARIAGSLEFKRQVATQILEDTGAQAVFAGQSTNPEDLEGVTRELDRSIKIRLVGADEFVVEAQSNNPAKAYFMAHHTITAFVNYESEAIQERIDRVINFIDNQITAYSDQVTYYQEEMNDLERERLRMNLSPSTQVRISDAEQIVAGIQNLKDKAAQLQHEIQRMRQLGEQDFLKEEEALLTEQEKTALYYERVNAWVVPSTVTQKEYAALLELQTRISRMRDKYTESYPPLNQALTEETNLKKKLDELIERDIDRAIAEKQAEIEKLNAEIGRLEQRRNLLLERINQIPNEQQEREKLEADLRQYSALVSSLMQRKQNILMTREMILKEEAKVLNQASFPQSPRYPRRGTIIVSGFLLGLFLGLAFAFLQESMDSSMATIEDVEQYIGKPVVALIPAIRPSRRKAREYKSKSKTEKGEFLISLVEPRSPATEAYRTLRTTLLSTFFNEERKLLAVTSATPQEGKTTTSCNLAVTMANVGKKTILVGCNLRHPSLKEYFPVNPKLGIQNIIKGEKTLDEVIQSSSVENLDILDSGGYLSSPSEVLENPGMDLLLSELRERYDVVILDTPPVLPVTDAAVLSRKVDGVLLVYFFGVAARDALLRARVQLENVGTNIVGILLNDIRSEGEKLSYYYYYSHGYGVTEG